MNIKLFLGVLFTALLCACNQSDTQHTTQDDQLLLNQNSTVASYNGSTLITIADMDNYIQTLAVDKRWNHSAPEAWYKNLIKNLVVEKSLLVKARASDIENAADFIQNARAIERIAYSNQYLGSQPNVPKVTEEDVLKYYEAHIEQYDFPEKRLVFHIYKSIGQDPAKAKSSLLSLRIRVINGENFQLLATQYSESETRHKQGYLGVFKKDATPTAINDVVFSLKKGIPSQVIKIGKGYHLFFVKEIIEQKKYPFSSVKNDIFSELSTINHSKHLKQQALNLPLAHSAFVPNEMELKNIIQANNGPETILRAGKYSLTYQLIKKLFIHNSKPGQSEHSEINVEFLEDIAYREIIYQYMLSNNLKYHRPEIVSKLKKRLLLSLYKDKRIRTYLENNPQLISDYFNNNSKRFYSPIYLHINKLTNPKAGRKKPDALFRTKH